jgi:ubiquitin-activating enzyme E1
VLANLTVPPFSPKQGVKIQVQENENMQQNSDTAELDAIVKTLPAPSTLAGYRLNPSEFEKVFPLAEWHALIITQGRRYKLSH